MLLGVTLERPLHYLPIFSFVRIGIRKPSWPKNFIQSNPLKSAIRRRALPTCWARPSPPSTCSTPAWDLLSTWSLSLKIPSMYLRRSPFTATTLSSGKTLQTVSWQRGGVKLAPNPQLFVVIVFQWEKNYSCVNLKKQDFLIKLGARAGCHSHVR